MTDNQMDGWMDGRMDGWMDSCICPGGHVELCQETSVLRRAYVEVLAEATGKPEHQCSN